MSELVMTRRGFFAIAVSANASLAGCGKKVEITADQKEKTNAVAEAVVKIGGAIVTIPHPIAKIIGITLVVSGFGIKLFVLFATETQPHEIALTPDQKDKLLHASIEPNLTAQLREPDAPPRSIDVVVVNE